MAKARGVFITGSDTGVGKTYVACTLIRALQEKGLRVAPRKPVESGCADYEATGKLSDAQLLAQAMQQPDPIETISPYRLQAAVSPWRAAQLEGVTLSCDALEDACQCPDDALLIIEGAGGLLSPLAEGCSNAELAKRLNTPLVLVVADKLGCINHALLTLQVAQAMGIAVLATVLNRLPGHAHDGRMTNLDEIKAFSKVPAFEASALDDILLCLQDTLAPNTTSLHNRHYN